MKRFLLRPLALLFVVALAAMVGCTKRKDAKLAFGNEPEPEYILAFVFDMSLSFLEEGSPKANKLFLAATQRFKTERIGSNDRILISQLSASPKPLIWQGKPKELQKDFASPQALQNLLKKRSNPYGSPVYATIAHTLDHLLNEPGVASGKTRVCVIVMTDYEDSDSNGFANRELMRTKLREFATRTNGSIGFYWVDQGRMNDLRNDLASAGLPASRYKIVGEFKPSSELPNFE